MQDMTLSACPATATAAKDSRDDKTYLIQKLADGKCWMVQNLALAGGTVLNTTTSNTSYTLPASSASDFYYAAPKNMYNGTHINGAADNQTNNTGAYYSFSVATADTGTGSSGNATGNICPKGWRLPTGGNGDEFQTLYNTYGNYNSFNDAFRGSLVGYYSFESNGPADERDSYLTRDGAAGSWWSSTIKSSSLTYTFYIGTSSAIIPYTDGSRNYGRSIRCVLGP